MSDLPPSESSRQPSPEVSLGPLLEPLLGPSLNGASLNGASWTFEQACAHVLDFLQADAPLGMWAITRREGQDQVFVDLRDTAFGVTAGACVPWKGSLCDLMVAGAPPAAPVAQDVAEYAEAISVREWGVRAYVGVPITSTNPTAASRTVRTHPTDGDPPGSPSSGDLTGGRVYGTLCGYHPETVDPAVTDRLMPMMRLLAALLGQILTAEALREQALVREAELRRLASIDDLTGLATRRVLHDRLEHALDLHRGAGRPLSVLLIDLDHFKTVNDTHGHAAGDELLCALTQAWGTEISSGNTLARLGGDEFALLVENGLTPHAITDKVTAALTSTHYLPSAGTTVTATLSVGLAHLTADAPTPTASDVLAHADAAMYAAKRSGGARLVTYPTTTPAAATAVSTGNVSARPRTP